MCGIVGYVGDAAALGRRDRGAAPAGVPRLRLGRRRARRRRRRIASDKRAGQARQPREGARGDAAAAVHDRHRAHPLGHPRRAQRRQRAPAPRRTTAGSRWSTTASSRTSPQLRDELEADGPRAASPRPTPRSPPTCSRRELPSGAATSPTAMQRGLPPARGRVHPGRGRRARTPTAWSAARRNSPLVVGLGEGENFLGSDVAAFIEHTREALELGQDQVVTITRDGVAVTDFDGTPAEGSRYHVDWDLSAAEKDGYDWFMRKEIFEQPRRSPTRCSVGTTTTGALQLDEMRISDDELRDDRQDHHHRAAARRSTPAWSRSTPSSTGPGSRARSSSPTSSATATRSSTRDTLVVAISQSGETADTLMAIRHAREQRRQGAGDLQHQRLDDPARVRRGHLHPRRPGDRGRLDQGLPDPAGRLLPARALPRPGRAAPSTATRSPRSSPSWQQMPGHVQRVLDDAEPVYAAGRASSPTRSRCCSSAGTSASRSRSRARSSSRSWPTSTPRASRPASSSTARSR